MQGPIELVVTDLDGTLWDGGEQIHDRTLAALAALEHRGVPLLVATGRRLRSAAATLGRSGLAPPAVVLDGAIGRDLATGEVFHEAPFAPGAAAAVLEAFTAEGLSPCVYVDTPSVEVFVDAAPSTSPRHLAHIGRWLGRDDLPDVVARERVFAVGIAGGDRTRLERVVDRFTAQTPLQAAGVVSRDPFHGGATLIVRPPGISKWEGVQAFCAAHGLDPARVLAVGDGENDVELLTGASVACVVRDGCDAALALADHVLDPAAAGGWSAILELV